MKKRWSKIIVGFLLLFCLSTSFAYAFNKVSETENNSEENKIIYLTFDDGPSYNTNNILDTLKEYDVKATFFVIGNQIKGKEEILKRIKDEGHSIGLHTYTHNFKKIYSDNKIFIDEMLKCQEEVYKVTGIKSNIIRFPGGSAKRLDKEFKEELNSRGFKIYDWNIDSGDGINPKTPINKLFKRATESNIKSKPRVLLMHCDNVQKNTSKALPDIIKLYKDKGYEFKTINNETPEYHFPLKK